MNKKANKLVMVLLAAVFMLFVTGCSYQDQAKVRTVVLNEASIDYQSFFNEFEDAELELDEQTNSVRFVGTQYIPQSLMDEFDLVSCAENNDTIGIRYEFDYSADTNIFYLSAIADVADGEIVDKWQGTPFITETGETDVCFATDDGILYLSELEESGALQNCGWLSKKLKRICKIAAVVAVAAVVAAVVIVAVPAVTAAATTVSTAMAVGGGAAALTGGTATAALGAAVTAGAAAMATTQFAVATTVALAATMTAVKAYVQDRTFSNLKEKTETVAIELSKTKEFKGKMIFRGQLKSDINVSLTPRAIHDDTGLSFFDSIPHMFDMLRIKYGVFITTQELVQSTGKLKARKDKGHHVSILPTICSLNEWIASYALADIKPHACTKALREVCYYVSL